MKNKLGDRARKLLVLGMFSCMFLVSASVFAQTTVTGNVTSEGDGLGLPGVNVIVKNTSKGVTTDFDGNFSITLADADVVLVFSSLGFTSKDVSAAGKSVINVVLEPSAEALEEVVVTALGIKREEKSLGYSVGKVKGEELTRVAQENVLNSMSGKVSGVTISSTGGTGSSVSMVIRGATSLSTDNQPLFVVDGVPLQSSANNTSDVSEEAVVDYGNSISDLDPESIESVSILKGPSAAALYGSRAGNGVVLITTKKAKKGQKTVVSVNTNTVFETPIRYLNTIDDFAPGYFSYRPEYFGSSVLLPYPINPAEVASAGPETDRGYWAVQWGAELDALGNPIATELVSYKDNFKNFLNDFAYTTTNGVSVASSAGDINYRLGYTNMTHEGLIPNTDLKRNNVTFSASTKLWDKLTIATDVNFSNAWADNRPYSGKAGPLKAVIFHPMNTDIRRMENYRNEDGSILRLYPDYENPYFLANEVNNSYNRYRLYGNISAKWEISPAFDFVTRVLLNKSDEVRETKIGVGFLQEPNNGAYAIYKMDGLERNIDFLLTYKKDWEDQDLRLTTSVGGNSMYIKGSNISNSSGEKGSGLIVPNLYTVQNISSGTLRYESSRHEKAIYSAYGLANISWKDMLYLDITARNDWSSTLPSDNRSYFYPSVSTSLLLDQVFDMGDNLDLFKIRAGWAQVGNDTKPYNLLNTYDGVGAWGSDSYRVGTSSERMNSELKPEQAESLEFGADVKMFNSRLRFEGTYYTVDNRNQILAVPVAGSSGYSSKLINAGLLESTGYEFLLGGTPIKTENWTWNVDLNFTKSETVIKELAPDVDQITFWSVAKALNIGYAKDDALGRDGLIGNIYGRAVSRVTDKDSPYFGYPIVGETIDAEYVVDEEISKLGNYNADFIMGMQSSLAYKNFTLDMTFDWRSGGVFISRTSDYLSEAVVNNLWLEEMVNVGDLSGTLSQELEDYIVANADRFLFTDKLRPVGGPTPEHGGFEESYTGVTLYDGQFAPGVTGYHEADGTFVLVNKNLGGPGTSVLPYVVGNPRNVARKNMFAADYIKLREVSLSYRFSREIADKLGMNSLNVSIYSRNIMLWTKDSKLGVDPERAYQHGSKQLRQGVELYNVEPWLLPIGFKLGFTF